MDETTDYMVRTFSRDTRYMPTGGVSGQTTGLTLAKAKEPAERECNDPSDPTAYGLVFRTSTRERVNV